MLRMQPGVGALLYSWAPGLLPAFVEKVPSKGASESKSLNVGQDTE